VAFRENVVIGVHQFKEVRPSDVQEEVLQLLVPEVVRNLNNNIQPFTVRFLVSGVTKVQVDVRFGQLEDEEVAHPFNWHHRELSVKVDKES